MQNRLLILGTQFEFTELVKRAVKRGYYTVVCDGYPEGPARAFADKAYTIDIQKIDEIARLCREERIDHIITSFSDLLFECMVKIAAKTGLPCYIQENQLDAYRSKEATKKICSKLGIKVPQFFLIRRKADLAQVGDSVYPALIKPVDSYGSRGLTIVRSREEAEQALESAVGYSFSGAAMLESISRGQELNCMGFVTDGTVRLLSIADRMTEACDEVHIPVNYAIRYPSASFDLVREKVQDIFQRFIGYTGQKWGPVAMQCFYDGTQIEVCEIAGRLFGFEHEMVTLTTGLDIEDLLLDLEYDREQAVRSLSRHDPKGSRFASCVYLQNIIADEVGDLGALRELESYPPVASSVLFYTEGERTAFLGPKQYFARYYLCADSREEMLEHERYLLRHAKAPGKENGDLLFIPAAYRWERV